MAATGLLVLRFALAAILMAHGAHTLFGAFEGPGIGPGGLGNAAHHFASIGLTPGMLIAAVGGVLQMAGAVLLTVGLFARASALAVAIYLAIVLWKEAVLWGFFLNWTNDQTRGQGVEYQMLLIAALVCLVLAGAGEWSLDGRRAHSAARRAAGRARARSGIR